MQRCRRTHCRACNLVKRTRPDHGSNSYLLISPERTSLLLHWSLSPAFQQLPSKQQQKVSNPGSSCSCSAFCLTYLFQDGSGSPPHALFLLHGREYSIFKIQEVPRFASGSQWARGGRLCGICPLPTYSHISAHALVQSLMNTKRRTQPSPPNSQNFPRIYRCAIV